MKNFKFLLVFAVLIFGISNIFAQKEHLKFSGIAIDGNITQFQSKLLSKGYVLDKELNSRLPVGSRVFKGTFVNNKVSVCVYYDESSKNVYKVKVIIDNLTEDLAKQKLNKFKELLNKKYDAYFVENDDAFSLLPIRNTNISEDMDKKENYLGEIDVYIREEESMLNYPYHYQLHIDYIDQINLDKHENNVIEDL